MAEKTNAQQGQANGMTKTEAVRRALKDKGKDAKPAELQPYIKEKFGIAMSTDHITTCKSKLKHTRKGKKKAAPKAQAQPPLARAPAQMGGGITLDDLQAVKGLIGRFGPDRLRTVIDLLSR